MATLQKEPRRFRSLHGAAFSARLSGHGELSARYFGELLDVCPHPDGPVRPEIKEARQALAGRKG